MTDSWTSYPKIHALGHAASPFKMADDVYAEEKIDGSQFSFGSFGGNLRMRSRNVQLHEVPDPSGMFRAAVETAQALHDAGLLRDGWTYRGEYLAKPKHNSLAYERIPERHIILFDVAVGLEDYADRETVCREAARLGLEAVPVLAEGRLAADELFALVKNSRSILGGMVEGVVLKTHSRKQFGDDGKPAFAKFVSEAFKEVHRSEWKKTNPSNGDRIAAICSAFRSEARWAKAVNRLRDDGRLVGGPEDIGALIAEVRRDVETEDAEEIKRALWDTYRKQVLGASVVGLPEWYKERLARDVLPEKTD